MKNNLSLSVVIPVYNEETAVKGVIEKLKSELGELDIEHEIIAVDDNSNDNSLEILNNIDEITVLKHNVNKGYGSSLKTGIKKSKYNWIMIIDADGTYPTEPIRELVKKINDNDMVVGSREKKGSAIPAERKHAKKFLNKFASYLSGCYIPDLNSGLRIFKKEIVFKYWDLFPERFSFTSTLTMICSTHGYEIKFYPINYHKRSGKSSIKPTDFFRFLKLVTKLSLFFKPFKVFAPISLVLLLIALCIPLMAIWGLTERFLDTTFIVLVATALQTFFFGLLAEIIIHNRR